MNMRIFFHSFTLYRTYRGCNFTYILCGINYTEHIGGAILPNILCDPKASLEK